MFVEPIQPVRTFEAAIERVIDGIERSRLRTGDRLPKEEVLAHQLGVSKPTLRQALRALEQAGLLSVRRGAGGGIFVVSDFVPIETISNVARVREEQVVDILNARRVLEGQVARLAVLHAPPEALDEIDWTVHLLERAIGDRTRVMEADAMFHRAVSRACGNVTLQRAVRSLGTLLAPIRDAYVGTPDEDRDTLAVHREQARAMRQRDLAGLGRVLDRHFAMLERDFAEAVGRRWEDLFLEWARSSAAGFRPSG